MENAQLNIPPNQSQTETSKFIHGSSAIRFIIVVLVSSPLVEFHPFDGMPWALPCEPKCAAKIDTSRTASGSAVPNIGKTVEWNVCNTIINQTLNYPRSNSSMPTQFCSIFVFAIRYSSVECVSIHLSSTQCATVTLQLYHICSRSVYSLLTFSSRSFLLCVAFNGKHTTEKWTLWTGLKAYEVAYCLRRVTLVQSRFPHAQHRMNTVRSAKRFIRFTWIQSEIVGAIFRARKWLFYAIRWFSLGPTVFESTPTIVRRSHYSIHKKRKLKRAPCVCEGVWKNEGKYICCTNAHDDWPFAFNVNGI